MQIVLIHKFDICRRLSSLYMFK